MGQFHNNIKIGKRFPSKSVLENIERILNTFQVGKIVFFIEVRILIPGDVSFVTDGTEQASGFTLGKRPSGDCDNWSCPLIEKRTHIKDGGHARLLHRGLTGAVDLLKLFGSDLWRGIFNQHQGRITDGRFEVGEYDFRALGKIDGCGRERRS